MKAPSRRQENFLEPIYSHKQDPDPHLTGTNLSFFGRGSEGALASSGESATSASSRSGDLHVPPPSAPPPLAPPVSSLTAAGTRSIIFSEIWVARY
jgi:hypothetical protein